MSYQDILLVSVILLILDAIFITLIYSTFASMIQNIQKSPMKVRYLPIPFVYIIMVLSLYILVLKDRQPIWKATLLGIAIYGVYDMTNLATISGWNWKMSIVDTLWGGVCFTLTAYLYYYLKDDIN